VREEQFIIVGVREASMLARLKKADHIRRSSWVNDHCLQMLTSGLKKILTAVVEFVAAHSISR
jgi:hypothetical protein